MGFEQTALGAIRWAYQAHRLYVAAQVFARPEAEAMKAVLFQWGTRSVEQLEAIQHLRAYTGASNLLYGLAIENAHKTRQTLDGRVSVEGGELKGLRTGHNILEMVRSCGISLKEEELDVLKSITFATVTMGKYSVARSARRQKDFTGRTYGTESVAPLAKRIIVGLLKDSPYTDIFLRGRHSGVDDTV